MLSRVRNAASAALVGLSLAGMVAGPAWALTSAQRAVLFKKKPAAATYQGPGDLGIGSFYAWYSCARSYSASYASPGTNKACDVVDTSTGAITCTYHIQTTGYVNVSECNGAGQSCQTACSVTRAYDQTGNGRDVIQATLANMPTLTLSALNSRPGMSCSGGSCAMTTASTFSYSQPATYVAIYKRTSVPGTAGGIIGDSNGSENIGSATTANNAFISAGTVVTTAATDNVYHFLIGLLSGSGSNCATNLDGTDTAAQACGTNNVSVANIKIFRATGNDMVGVIMETGILNATTTPTNRNSICHNSNGAYSMGLSC